ncbi:aminomethyltransferase family protein [Oceanicoccus sagamiensis]|uniref:Aminomethyltransferase n=1 Tax=Oceanicoccus sagamiensis TaxID=716816 RepID=A0A1X9N5W6_9GAMM|nr:aminomethyltransferase family protein [Oceanicoccus sagamiensis]ARN72671.1 aminomethyltransferase [Oceanicoccus sagamiensis]
MTNDIAPDPFAGERLKQSHFHPRQAALNIREAWSSWNGYKFADYYYDAEYEYFCVRNTCGTYDICPMQKYRISGSDAEAMLNRMVTRDISKLKQDRVTYVCWCTDEGRMVDDGTIFRLGEDTFMLTCGSPSIAWLRKSAFGFKDIKIVDQSDDIAALSFQGPTSCEVLKKMGLNGIEQLRPFGIQKFAFKDGEIMVSRTGFTGDLGYELWVEPNLALDMWDSLYAAGEDYGIQPYGEAATNMARLEAGFIMPDMEFSEALKTIHFEHDQTPFELNLGWLVDFNKPHFNGRQALLKEKQHGPEYTLVKLDIDGNKPAEESHLYSDKACEHEIGYVTSAMWSPVVKANIALAMVKTSALKGDIWAEIYYTKELRHNHKVERCRVQDQPFWAPDRAKATPPPTF